MAPLKWQCVTSWFGGKSIKYRSSNQDAPTYIVETDVIDETYIVRYVAERISYFCLARNLIQPLGSTHNFTQSGWLILCNPDHLSGQHKLGKSAKHSLFSELLRSVQTSSIAAAASHHHEGSSLIYGPLASISLRPRVPSWIWIRWIEYATHRNNFTSPPKLAMSTAMQNSAPTPSYFISGQHFLETFTLLPETTRATNSRWLQSFLSSNSKHGFCYTTANISPSTHSTMP